MFSNNINPFLSQTQSKSLITSQPAVQQPQQTQQTPTSLIGTTNPFSKASFGHLAGVTKNGPGSFLQAEPGQMGLGNKAIQLGDNKVLGKELYISI